MDIKIYVMNQATFMPSFMILALKKNELKLCKGGRYLQIDHSPPLEKKRNSKILW